MSNQQFRDLTPEEIGKIDLLRFGDLLDRFGPDGSLTDKYLQELTDATTRDFRAAGHDFRNDSGIRPAKPYSR